MSEEVVSSATSEPAVVVEAATEAVVDTPIENAEAEVEASPEVVVEEKKPEIKVADKLASRFASLSKKEKQLEAAKAEIEAGKVEIEKNRAILKAHEEKKANAKEDPIRFLKEEYGIDPDDLIQAVVNGKVPEKPDPVQERIAALEAKLLEKERKEQEREEQAKKSTYEKSRAEYKALVETDLAEYPLAKEYHSADDIVETITRHYQSTGEVLSHKDVIAEYEEYYDKKLEAIKELDKVKSKLGLAKQAVEVKVDDVKTSKQDKKVPVTLSNKAGGSPVPVKNTDEMTPKEMRDHLIQKLKTMRSS